MINQIKKFYKFLDYLSLIPLLITSPYYVSLITFDYYLVVKYINVVQY
jgi:hypothetical protein